MHSGSCGHWILISWSSCQHLVSQDVLTFPLVSGVLTLQWTTDRKHFLLNVKSTFKQCQGTAVKWLKPTCTPLLNIFYPKEKSLVSLSVMFMFLEWVDFNPVWEYWLNLFWWQRGDFLICWGHRLWSWEQATIRWVILEKKIQTIIHSAKVKTEL